jgi:hypothetical protein
MWVLGPGPPALELAAGWRMQQQHSRSRPRRRPPAASGCRRPRCAGPIVPRPARPPRDGLAPLRQLPAPLTPQRPLLLQRPSVAHLGRRLTFGPTHPLHPPPPPRCPRARWRFSSTSWSLALRPAGPWRRAPVGQRCSRCARTARPGRCSAASCRSGGRGAAAAASRVCRRIAAALGLLDAAARDPSGGSWRRLPPGADSPTGPSCWLSMLSTCGLP